MEAIIVRAAMQSCLSLHGTLSAHMRVVVFFSVFKAENAKFGNSIESMDRLFWRSSLLKM